MTSEPALLGGPRLATKNYFFHSTDTGAEELFALKEVIDSQVLSGFTATPSDSFYGGVKVRQLEEEFSSIFGVKHAVSFNSATSALHAAVAAAGVGPGDQVITSPFTMSATASAILMQNGLPVFADIDENFFTISPASVRKALRPQTRAIIPVNLFGQPADLFSLREIARENGLVLIEDNAQAPLASINGHLAGTIGDMGVFSLNYHKAVQCGEGGVVVTNHDDYHKRLCLVRNHGETSVASMDMQSIANTMGWNYRMTELQAAVASVQMKKLERLNAIRIELASYLKSELEAFDFLIPPRVRDGCEHTYYFFPVKYKKGILSIHRNTFVRALVEEGFPVGAGYVAPLYWQSLYQNQIVYGNKGCPFQCRHVSEIPSYHKGLCPVAERMYQEELMVFKLCKYPNDRGDIDLLIEAIQKIIYFQEALHRWEISAAAGNM